MNNKRIIVDIFLFFVALFWPFILCFVFILYPTSVMPSATPLQAAYKGCEQMTGIPVNSENPRTRITERNNKTDPITQRSFASFSLEEIEAGVPKELDNLCWFRLDGVWRETGKIVLDTNQLVDGWGSDSEELLNLANGTYTALAHLFIQKTDSADSSLLIRDGLGDSEFVAFNSGDSLQHQRCTHTRRPCQSVPGIKPLYIR